MRIQINDLVEQIFAQAVALDQSGGLRNTIYAQDREIYIMNYDHTVLLRFRLRSSEMKSVSFSSPISFKANDYDSNDFHQEGDRITFYSETEGYSKKKICGTTDLTTQQVKELFNEYIETTDGGIEIQLNKEILTLLDDSLSHVEFTGEIGGQLKLIQRNIYTGGIIEIQQKIKPLLDDSLSQKVTPVAIKTDDFRALFNFQDNWKFIFPISEKSDYVIIHSIDKGKRDVVGILACCLYDEIIELKQSNHGR